MKHTMHRFICFLCCLSLCCGSLYVQAAPDPEFNNVPGKLIFVAGSGFISKSRAVYANSGTTGLSLTAYYLGGAKEASYAEIPIVSSGIGLLVDNNLLSKLKVSSDSKAVKVSFDKSKSVLKVTAAGLGRGTITVTGSYKEDKTTYSYSATLPFVVQPPENFKTEIGLKAKGSKDTVYRVAYANADMQVGESLTAQIQFASNEFGYFTYGGSKSNGFWQSLDPSYLSVSNDGKLKAITATESGKPARALFTDFLGNVSATLEVVITAKANAKLDNWNGLTIQYKGTGKGLPTDTVKNNALTWELKNGPFQLTALLPNDKGKSTKANVFYYTTQPAYAAIDSKGICYPLKVTNTDNISVQVYVVGLDFTGQKQQRSFTLTIVP